MNEAKSLSPEHVTALRILRGFGPLRAMGTARHYLARGHSGVTPAVIAVLETMLADARLLAREHNDWFVLMRAAQVLRERDQHSLAASVEHTAKPLREHVDNTLFADGLPIYGRKSWPPPGSAA